MLKLLIFDLDGTLLDSDLLIVESWVRLYQKFRPDYKPRLSKILTFSGPALETSVAQEFPNADPKKVISYYRRISKNLYLRYAQAFPGAKECLEECHKRGLIVAVNTNKNRSFSLLSLSSCGLAPEVDFLVAGDDVKKSKPSPEGIEKAMALAGVFSKEEVLYIGDTVYDYETAENANVDCLLVDWGNRKLPFTVHPRYHLDDFKDFFEVVSL